MPEKMRFRHCASLGRNDRCRSLDQARFAESTGYPDHQTDKYISGRKFWQRHRDDPTPRVASGILSSTIPQIEPDKTIIFSTFNTDRLCTTIISQLTHSEKEPSLFMHIYRIRVLCSAISSSRACVKVRGIPVFPITMLVWRFRFRFRYNCS